MLNKSRHTDSIARAPSASWMMDAELCPRPPGDIFSDAVSLIKGKVIQQKAIAFTSAQRWKIISLQSVPPVSIGRSVDYLTKKLYLLGKIKHTPQTDRFLCPLGLFMSGCTPSALACFLFFTSTGRKTDGSVSWRLITLNWQEKKYHEILTFICCKRSDIY